MFTFVLGRLGLGKVLYEFEVEPFEVEAEVEVEVEVDTFRRVEGDGGRSVREVNSEVLPGNFI